MAQSNERRPFAPAVAPPATMRDTPAYGSAHTPHPQPRMRLVEFRPVVKGALRGFATVELANGITIVDCAVCSAYGRAWVSLPAKPQVDRDGGPVTKGGKIQYTAILRWRDRDLSDRFSDAVLSLVRAEHPDALDDGGAP